MWVSGKRAGQAEVTANAKALSWEHVFCVAGTSGQQVLLLRRNKGKQAFDCGQVNLI